MAPPSSYPIHILLISSQVVDMYQSYGTYVNDESVDDYDCDDTDDDNDHKKDRYTGAGAAPTQARPDSDY